MDPIKQTAQIAMNTKAAEFSNFAKMLLVAKEPGEFQHLANSRGTERIKALAANMLGMRDHFEKAAVNPLDTSSALGEYTDLSEAFLESVGSVGAFDRIVSSMRPVPMMSDIAAVTAAGSAFVIGEGQLKKITRLSIDSTRLEPRKIIAVIVMSNELARFSGVRGARLFRSELQKATATATDTEFISELTSGITPIPSLGSTMAAVRSDLRVLLQAINSDDASKFFLLMSSSTAKNLALLEDGELLKDFNVTGGKLAGIECVLTDAAQNNLIMLDANQVAADRGMILPARSTQALVQMSDSPDSPATASTISISLFQQNMSALRIERWFAIERLRTASVAVVSNVSYGGANSPA